jgi:hypothetical protein
VVEFEDLKRMAVMLLSKDGQLPSKEMVENAVDTVMRIAPEFQERTRLVRDIEATFSITVADGTMLSEDAGHAQWLDGRRATIEWDFWRRYRTWLSDVKGWSPTVVNKIDSLTDQVLERIEEPNRLGSWDRRGLVVGQVQSGKTSHYTGLICKAVDAGYRLIIVLAGVHKSLRSQTQLRLDEGFLGLDTQLERAWKKNTNRIGAGLASSKPLHVAYLTNSADNGDFKKGIARQIGIPLGSLPILLVVKKNSGVLRNLVTWLQTQAGAQDDHGAPYFTDIPILLLDDEADHASINTKETVLGADGEPMTEQEATAINTRIRGLLKMFAKSVYVGYTATPFANVFIHPYVNTTQIGRDLFPRSFILNLPAPSNYLGPVQVFGLGEETDNALEQNGLPTIRIIDDYQTDLPQNHKKGHYVPALPSSLRRALLAFVLSCASRAARGQASEHNSMLVHVTRFTDVQERVAELIEQELFALRNRIIYGDGERTDRILDELELLWRSDFEPTFMEIERYLDDPAMVRVAWGEVDARLRDAVAKITVKKINGSAKDVLDYFGNPEGISVIAIGGDKLSRGLTLEGLTVSYYLRASRMYDTLMQMGRWFGYRPGYADLCRLYTTDELVSWYRHITVASEELRRDFDEMVRAGRSPEDFGLKVRAHPGNLIITGAGKLRNHTRMRVSFSDRLIESYRISSTRQDQQGNFIALGTLIGSLGRPDATAPHYLWRDIDYETVTGFLRDLTGYPGAFDFAPGRLAEIIDNLADEGELEYWNIALINISRNATKSASKSVAGFNVGYSERNPNLLDSGHIEIKQRHIISMDHEWIDIEPPQEEEARRLWKAMPENAGKPMPTTLAGKLARRVRGAETGLLLLYLLDPTREGLPQAQRDLPYLGYALSFPASDKGDERAVSYMVNSIYAQEEFEED